MIPAFVRTEMFQSKITNRIIKKITISEIFQSDSNISLSIKDNSNLIQNISLVSLVHIEGD